MKHWHYTKSWCLPFYDWTRLFYTVLFCTDRLVLEVELYFIDRVVLIVGQAGVYLWIQIFLIVCDKCRTRLERSDAMVDGMKEAVQNLKRTVSTIIRAPSRKWIRFEFNPSCSHVWGSPNWDRRILEFASNGRNSCCVLWIRLVLNWTI